MFEYDCEVKCNNGYVTIKFLSEVGLTETEVRYYLLNNSGLTIDVITELHYTELDLGKWRK